MQYLISKYQARFYELYENFRSKKQSCDIRKFICQSNTSSDEAQSYCLSSTGEWFASYHLLPIEQFNYSFNKGCS